MTEDTALRPPLELLLERSPAMDFARRTVTLGRTPGISSRRRARVR